MRDIEAFYDVCMGAIDFLDSALGIRASGMVVSGAGTPRFMCDESPFDLTKRSLVNPMMSLIGYGAPCHRMTDEIWFDGTILAVMPMNRPLDGTLRHLMTQMRGDGAKRGILTDGFTWILLTRGAIGPRVDHVADLRPYYVEVLDRSRFRASVPVNPGCAELFMERFGR